MSTRTADLTRAQDDVDRLTDLRDGLDAGTAVAADVGVLTGLDRGDRAYEQVLTELEDARALVARLMFEEPTGERNEY